MAIDREKPDCTWNTVLCSEASLQTFGGKQAFSMTHGAGWPWVVLLSPGLAPRVPSMCVRRSVWVREPQVNRKCLPGPSASQWLACLEFLGLAAALVSRCGSNLNSVFVNPGSLSPKSTCSFEKPRPLTN